MLQDGTKAKEVEEQVGTYDIAEILVRAVFGEDKPAVEETVEEELAVDAVEETVAVEAVEAVQAEAEEIAATTVEAPAQAVSENPVVEVSATADAEDKPKA